MFFFDIFGSLASLNFGFFIHAILDNLFWIFGFMVLNNAIFNGKNLFLNTALSLLYVWSFRTFLGMWGLEGFAANAFFFFIYWTFLRFFVLQPNAFGKHTGTVDVLLFYGFLFIFNFLLV